MTTRGARWLRQDVADSAAWTHVLTELEVNELLELVDRLRDREPSTLARGDIQPESALARASARWRTELKDGRGFVLVRGVPVEKLGPVESALAYAALGAQLGSFVPQNFKGELLTHVRDIGADPTDPNTRLYTTRAEQEFHTDGADVIGLLCLAQSRSGGESRIASSRAIVHAIRERDPELFAVLFREFPWHYAEAGRDAFWFARPICTLPAGAADLEQLNTFFIPWYIRRSQELSDAPRLSDLQTRALETIETLANDPEFHLDMSFQPGDIQWLKNAAILHKRTEYVDHDEPEKRRHLLRLWLDAPDFADGDAQLRGGVSEENLP